MEDSEYHGATPVAGTATAVLDPPRPRLQLTVHDLDSTIQLGLGGSYGKLAEYVAINSVDIFPEANISTSPVNLLVEL